MQSYGKEKREKLSLRKGRYERKRQSRLGILRILSEAKSGGSKSAEGNGRRGREKCPAAVTRRALVNNSKNSCTAYSLLKDGCRLTPRCFLWRAFQSGCPCWWLPGADRDSYRDGSVASQACWAFHSVPQIAVRSSHGSKQGAWQRQLLLGNLFVPPWHIAAPPALSGGQTAHRDTPGGWVITVHPTTSPTRTCGFILMMYEQMLCSGSHMQNIEQPRTEVWLQKTRGLAVPCSDFCTNILKH